MPFRESMYKVIRICFGCIPLLMIPWSTQYFYGFAENLTDNKIVKVNHFLFSSTYILISINSKNNVTTRSWNFIRNTDMRSDEWKWAHGFTYMSRKNTDLLISVPVTLHSYFHLCAQNSKERHFRIISAQNTSVAHKNYSEKKCSGTLPLSSNSQNIHFTWLIMEQHTGDNSWFSIKPRRNETFSEPMPNWPPILMHLEYFYRNINSTKDSQSNF